MTYPQQWFRGTWRLSLGMLVLLTFFAGNGCSRREEPAAQSPTPVKAQPLPRLTVGYQVSPAMALLMVAKDQNYYAAEGVEIELKEFTAGKFALQAFLGNSLDIAVSGEVPVTLATLQGNRFRVVAQVVERTTNEVRVVARRDGSFTTPGRYFRARRRKLATSFGGGPEFYTYNFLKKYGIQNDDVELISQKPEDMPAAIASGSVDAVSIFDPFARIAERRLGAQGITFEDPALYSELYVVNVRDAALSSGKRGAIAAFLRALKRAEAFISSNPGAAKASVAKYTKLDAEIIEEIWPHFVFRVAMNDLFLTYTTAEAKWAVEKGTFPQGTPIPDFRAVLYPDLLRSIDSSAVSLDGK